MDFVVRNTRRLAASWRRRQPAWPLDAGNRLIEALASAYFEPLIEARLDSFPDEEREAQRRRSHDDFRGWLAAEVGRVLTRFDKGGDGSASVRAVSGAEALLRHARDDCGLRSADYPAYTQELKTLFARPPALESPPKLADKAAITAIVFAIQQVLLDTPRRFSSRHVRSAELEAMSQVLDDLEQLRQQLNLGIPVLDRAQALTRLHLYQAREEERAWLPLRPPLAAPLQGDALLMLYSRDEEQAQRLAQQIVLTDGVILVTGYRGVGKSTFVNLVVDVYIPRVVQFRIGETMLSVVPIRINLAKASSVRSVLRQTIRTLYDTLLGPNARYSQLLTDQERALLGLAYLRASYKFSREQAETVAHSVEQEVALAADFARLLPGVAGVPLPAYEGRIGRSWRQEAIQTIGLLDYDEDRAEEDIIRLISLLSRPRPLPPPPAHSLPGRVQRWLAMRRPGHDRQSQARLKLVFIFDEMDKMDEEEGQEPLIRQLKNLFLAGNAVFLLVTSKRFYYRWLQQRMEEDSILASYFSGVETVRLFRTAETARLLDNLILIDANSRREPEERLLLRLAGYFTYQAMGVPREIVRVLQKLQQWVPGSLLPYLGDNSDELTDIYVYAAIQEALEQLDWSDEASGGSVQERFSLHEGVHEQIRRGRYVLVEALLNRGRLSWSRAFSAQAESSLATIYHNNFDLVEPRDFVDILDRLADALTGLALTPTGPLEAWETELSERRGRLFRLEQEQEDIDDGVTVVTSFFLPVAAHSGRDATTLRVDDLFYRITGRRAPETRERQPGSYSDADIEHLLRQDSRSAVGEALLALRGRMPEDVPTSVQRRLYRLLVDRKREDEDRRRAGRLLRGDVFLEQASEELPVTLLEEEPNLSVLGEVVRLTRDGVARNGQLRGAATELLLRLLERTRPAGLVSGIFEKLAPGRGLGHALPAPTFTEVVTAIAEVADSDVLSKVVKQLDPARPLEGELLTALLLLADTSAERLPVLLALNHFQAPSQQTVAALLAQEDDPAALWEALYSHKGQQFAQASLAGLLAQLGSATQLPPPVTGWLGQEQWDDGDYLILYRATGMNPLVAEVVTGQGEMARQHLQVMEERVGEWSSRLWQEEGKSEDLLTGGLVDAEAALRELANIRFGTASALETARPVQDYKDLYLGTRYGLLSGATDTGTTSSKPWWSEVDLSEYILYALFPLLYVFFDVKWDLPEEASNWEQLLAKTLTLAYILAPLVATALLVYWKWPWVLRLGAAAGLLLVSAGSFLALRDWLQHPLTLWGQLGLGALVALMVGVVLLWSWTFEQKWRADVLDSVYRKL